MTKEKPAFAPDYVQVNERIIAFREKFPEGSLQAEIVEHTDKRITMRAFAYRTPTDERPGIGHSTLEIPGKTPYTRGSEIENCETSAWGRALAALGFEVKRGIASREEVANKRENSETDEPQPEKGILHQEIESLTAAREALKSAREAAGLRPDELIAHAVKRWGVERPRDWTVDQCNELAAWCSAQIDRLGDALGVE